MPAQTPARLGGLGMRQAFTLLIVATLLLGGRLAFAAALPLGPTSLAVGTVAVTACDPDGVKVDYRLGWNGHFVIDQVAVSGIADACVGLRLAGYLTVGDQSIKLPTVGVPATSHDNNTVVVRLTGDVWANRTRSVHLVIA